MARRSPLRRHLELESLFGTDLLPVSRHARAPKAAEPGLPADFAKFRDEVLACRKCSLCKTRTQVVFGVGTLAAPIVFVGEAPGADEDAKGEPFVGRAGQLLTRTIEKWGVRREQVYIANILKCRPPENRTPSPEEMATCSPWLLEQLEWIEPKLVCAMGNIAVKALLGTPLGITKLRGRVHDYQGRRLFATYHPAYILRNPGDLEVFEQDVRQALREAGLAP